MSGGENGLILAGMALSGADVTNTAVPMLDVVPLPKHLLVLGGGPIGCELAQAFARFGAQVTLVEMAPRLLAREDPEVSEIVARRFTAEGIAPNNSWSKTASEP